MFDSQFVNSVNNIEVHSHVHSEHSLVIRSRLEEHVNNSSHLHKDDFNSMSILKNSITAIEELSLDALVEKFIQKDSEIMSMQASSDEAKKNKDPLQNVGVKYQ